MPGVVSCCLVRDQGVTTGTVRERDEQSLSCALHTTRAQFGGRGEGLLQETTGSLSVAFGVALEEHPGPLQPGAGRPDRCLQPASYLAIARSVGSDEALMEVFEETRTVVVALILSTLGLVNPPAGPRIVVRGWIAMVEESVLHWIDGSDVPRHQLVGFLQRAAVAMLPDALLTFSQPPAQAAG